MMNVTKRCSKCRKYKPDDNYGLKKNGTEYRTCMTCRNKQPPTPASSSSSQSVSDPNLEEVFALNRGIAEREAQRTNERSSNVENSIVWKKGFLNTKPKTEHKPKTPIRTNTSTYEEICSTLEYYGIKVYTKDDIYLKYFNPFDFKPLAYKLHHKNSVFMFQLSCPPTYDEISFCEDILRIKCSSFELKEPSLLIMYNDDEEEPTKMIFTPYVNVLANYVHTDKQKNHKRCNICQQKKKRFRVCYRCNDKYCVECFHKLHDTSMKSCPYCRYSFREHIGAMFKRMIPNPKV